MQQLVGQFRDWVRLFPRLARFAHFGAMTVFSVIVLTACYTDVQVTPTTTPAATLAVATTAPQPTQAPEEQPPDGGDGGGGGEQPENGGGGDGGGGASPEAATETPIPTAARRVGSPVSPGTRTPASPVTGTRTPAGPLTGTRTPTKTGGTSQTAATKAPTARGVATTRPPGGVTMPAGTTPPAGGTVTPSATRPGGVTMPAGVTVTVTTTSSAESASPETAPSEVTGSPTTTPSEVTGSPTTNGTILITKRENFEAALLPGACFAVLSGDNIVAQACDNGDGDGNADPALIAISVPPGSYVLRETTAPENYMLAADATVEVVDGETTALDVIDHLIQPPGAIVIEKVDPAGTPLPGACFVAVTNGNPVATSCDNADSDTDDREGFIRIPVDAGSYEVVETPPAGYLPTSVAVQVTSGTETAVQVVNQPEPTVEASPSTETVTTGFIVASIFGEDRSTPFGQACLTFTGSAATYQVCDNAEGDVDPTEGAIELDGVPTGEYAITVTLPEGYETVEAPTSVVVETDAFASVTVVVRQVTGETAASPTTPVEQYGFVIATFILDDGSPLVGNTCLDLAGNATYAVCDNGEGDVDPTEGAIELDLVPVDEYTVTITPPEGYESTGDAPPSIRVDADQFAQITATFRATTSASTTGTVRIDKVDSADGVSPLEGACFELRGENGTYPVCDNDGSDADELVGDDNTPGVIVIANVVAGDYQLVETQTPEGRVAGPDQPVRVDPDQTTTVAVANGTPVPPAIGSLVVTLVEAGDQAPPLGGACFLATDATGQQTERCDDDGDGTTRFEELAPGDYTVSQSRAPEGFQPAAEQPVTVNPGEEATLTFTNERTPPETGSLSLTIQDAAGQPVPDTCFDLTGPQPLAVCDNGEGDVEPAPGVILIQNLTPGEYTVTQTSAPEGFQLAAAQPVTVVAGTDATPLAFSNEPAVPETGSLSLSVQDDTGQPVAETCFDLSGPQALSICDNGEGDLDTTPGFILIQNLIPGDFTVTQTQAPAGYTLSEPLPVTVVAGTDPTPLTVVNPVQPVEPTGVDLPSPVVYSDDAGRLWLLRPGDTEPIRLDADDLRFDPSMDPVFSFDRTWVVFLISDPAAPGANMRWVKLEDLSSGAVDFGSVGTPRLVSWVPERSDTLIIATELPGGNYNVFLFATDLTQPPVPLFADDALPSQINAIYPAPAGPTVAVQVTDASGDPDTYLVNTADPNAPVVTAIGPNEGSTPDQFIAWSPAGDRLLLRSGTEPPLVSIVDLAGSATPLGANPLFDGVATLGTAPQWSADGGWVAAFNGDPATGGQLVLFDGAGNQVCDPIPDVLSADWSPVENRIWAIVATPDQPLRLLAIGTDCAQQEIIPFDAGFDALGWAPNGAALALVDYGDGGASVSFWMNDQLISVDTATAGLGLGDVFAWTPGGELLPLLTTGPSVSIWVAIPGDPTPVPIKGSTLPEGATYVTRLWWGAP